MKQTNATQPTALEISIVELERNLDTEEALAEVGLRDTLEFPVPEISYVPVPIHDDLDNEETGIHEIVPTKLTRWLHSTGQVYWITIGG